MLWNANLDRTTARKPLAKLREELRSWEAEQENIARRGKPAVAGGDAVEHERTHKSEFEKLVEQAKASRAKGAGDAKVPANAMVVDGGMAAKALVAEELA
jgi:hypothetical protein